MNNTPLPPRWIDNLIDHLAPNDLAEEIRGDLYELYRRDIHRKSILTARARYIVNALGFLLRRFFWKRNSLSLNTPSMLRNYFTIAYRSLLSYKSNTVINVLGLTIGMASALTIFTFIRHELSYDSFHSNVENIYRVVRVSKKDRSEGRTGISYPVPGALKDEIAAFQKITSMEYFGEALVEVPDSSGNVISRFKENNGLAMIEPSFFDVLDFKGKPVRWLQGNPDKALIDPFSVVLTESLAKKYFGDGNIVGKTLRFEKEADCKVTGVISDFPANTDFPFSMLISYSSLRIIRARMQEDWVSVDDNHQTYIMLPDNMTKQEAEAQIANVHAAHTPKDLHESRFYILQKISDVHFQSQFGTYSGRSISKAMLLAMAAVAVFLLVTCCINYINLATAQAAMRAKEVGLRKVMGSSRKSLVWQFLTETWIIVLTAGFISLALSEILLWQMQSLLNLPLQHHFQDPFILAALGIVVFVVTLFSGIYPSLSISKMNPVNSLKSKFTTETLGGFSFRKVLVVVQFTVTQIIAVSAFIVVSQMHFFRHQDMGFNQEAIITFPIAERDDSVKRHLLEDRFRAQSFVSNVTFSYTLPAGIYRRQNARNIWLQGENAPNIIFEYQAADSSYINVFGIKLIAGRNVNNNDRGTEVLITRVLSQRLNFRTPEEAIGQPAVMSGKDVTIVGVVDDFYNNSLKEDKGNIAIINNTGSFTSVSVKLQSIQQYESLQQAIAQLETIWKETYPTDIFEYRFFDDNVKAYYEQEQNYAQLFQMFSIIFLLIGCLGLYGLIAFVVNRKSKEVAIRKVLGATIPHILIMFSKEYIQLILISFAFAVPVAYYTVNSWLSNFKNHITPTWWMFLLPGLLVLAIAVMVILLKSMRTVRANPVDKLKYE
jgi:ABC-type antimicrobial peptide transport system permease subunit